MNCLSDELIKKLTEGNLKPNIEEAMLEHIYCCDKCMDKYINCLEPMKKTIPKSTEADVIKRIRQEERTRYKERIRIYAIAATFAVLFYGMGIFNIIFETSSNTYNKVGEGIKLLNDIRINSFMEE